MVKVEHVKPIQEKLERFYFHVIPDDCVKIAALEICCEKNSKESVVGT